jgi:hypothetical protein
MNEIGNTDKPKNKFWWQLSKSENYIIPVGEVETYTFTVPECD